MEASQAGSVASQAPRSSATKGVAGSLASVILHSYRILDSHYRISITTTIIIIIIITITIIIIIVIVFVVVVSSSSSSP